MSKSPVGNLVEPSGRGVDKRRTQHPEVIVHRVATLRVSGKETVTMVWSALRVTHMLKPPWDSSSM